MSNYDKTRSDLKKLVLPHWDIPRELLNSIARIPDFSVAIVKQCARSHSGRYPLFEEMGYGFDYEIQADHLRQIADNIRDQLMSGQVDFSKGYLVFDAGMMLEYHMVADALENTV